MTRRILALYRENRFAELTRLVFTPLADAACQRQGFPITFAIFHIRRVVSYLQVDSARADSRGIINVPSVLTYHREYFGSHSAFLDLWRAHRDPNSRAHFALDTSLEHLRARQDQAVAVSLMDSSNLAEALTIQQALLLRERAWPRLLVFNQILADGWLRIGRPAEAVLDLDRAVAAYRGMMRWLRRRGDGPLPDVVTEFPKSCAKALATLDPKARTTRDPVTSLAEVAAGLRVRRTPRPDRAISALDALVTLGRSSATSQFERRVGRELAALVGGWVLLHKRGRKWLSVRPQAEHTLSTWSIRRLGKLREFRTIRVRARPEFWRPEQRRPGGILAVPFGDGVICIAKRVPLSSREVEAVRTVLRFLAARLASIEEAKKSPLPSPDPLPIPHLQAPDALAGAPSRSPFASIVSRRVPARLPGEGLVGESQVWRDVLSQIARVAETTVNVLFVGETGTGKEMVVGALHAASLRHRGRLLAVNCGALTPSLLSSELFGHVRGAFTGADRSRDGVFVQAHRGTLFLDEVADMPVELQVALLRVIEDKSVRPLGSSESRAVDVRIVAACSRDLDLEVAAGRFREDLYHRICVVRIDLPPLRERREDIPLLAAYLAARMPEKARLHPDAVTALLAHDWPGNVRELDNVIRASAVFAEGGEIGPRMVEAVVAQRRRHRRGGDIAPPPPVASIAAPRLDALVRATDGRWISAGELADQLGVSARTVNRDLSDLLSTGRVRSAGEARARRYRSGPAAS